jgi:hypothetical protein
MSERVRLPADVELEDRLAFGLTARQLVILAATALAAYALFAALSPLVLAPVALAASTPVALVGLALALGRRDGLSGDRFAAAGVRHLLRPRRRALAPEGLPSPLRGAPPQPRLSPLDLPVRAVLRSGVIELTTGESCLLLAASGPSFGLRSEEEQAALVEAFGRFLNGLVDPTAIAVCAKTVDLGERAAALERASRELPHPALKRAAVGHARFLAELAEGEDIRRREILLILTTRARERSAAQAALERRASEAAELLRAAAVDLRALRGEEAAALLPRALDPPGPPPGAGLSGVVGAC